MLIHSSISPRVDESPPDRLHRGLPCGPSPLSARTHTLASHPSGEPHPRMSLEPPSAARLRSTLHLLILVSLLGTATARAALPTARLKLDLRDSGGSRIDARVSARVEALGTWFPNAPDSASVAHEGYSYPPSGSSIVLPQGWITLVTSRGPEWMPDTRRFYLRKDTTVTVRLSRFYDMRSRGLFASDLHAHSHHDPIELDIPPATAKRIARAEDLAILHLLDQDYRFKGTPDSISDANNILYYSFEHRHMTYGHVVLPGLQQAVNWGCCLAPNEAWPLLSDLAPQVAGPGRALFVLAHPVTTSDFKADTRWPGSGFGREYALLAASGQLDGFDVVSYSNEPHDRWQDWMDAVSSGIALTPTAGTDAVLNIFSHRPAGGWRVYADLGSGTRLDYRKWVEAVRAGSTFVTSLPLVPRFRVGEARPGEAIEAPSDTVERPVTIESACATGVSLVRLLSERGTVWVVDLSKRSPVPTRFDTTFTLRTATPGWLALRIDGVGGSRALMDEPAIAVTNAVRLLRRGEPRRDPAACGRMLDRIDALEALLQVRRRWNPPWHEDTVMARIGRARAFYGQVFHEPPAAFHVEPVSPAGVGRLSWTRATDREPGDKVRYRVTLAADSSFQDAIVFWTDSTHMESTPARASLPSWWRIEAVDRGGQVTPSTPAVFEATLLVATAGVEPPLAHLRPRVWPNPARGPVRLEGFGSDAMILDVAGRRIAAVNEGLRRDGAQWIWEARGARPGLYWAVSRSAGLSVPLTRLR